MYKIKQVPEDFVVGEESCVVPGKTGRYAYFLLRKVDYTTEGAVQIIANYLKIDRKRLGYAGNKDRRAVTEQVISVLGKAKEARLNGIETTLLGYGDVPVSLGDLKGNCFRIVVRNLSDKDLAAIKKNCELLKKGRFLVRNFFDEQRFSENNADIGRLIVKGKLKEAVALLSKGKGKIEAMVNAYAKAHPNDSAGALRTVPKKILQLYVHAFQSRIWNESAKILEKSRANIKIPIVGFGTELKGKVKEVVENALEKEEVCQRDFVIRKMPELSSEGGERSLFAKVESLIVSDAESDELNMNKVKATFEFSLPKGSYATLVVRDLLCE